MTKISTKYFDLKISALSPAINKRVNKMFITRVKQLNCQRGKRKWKNPIVMGFLFPPSLMKFFYFFLFLFFPSRNNPHIIWTIHFISHSPPSLMYENPPPLYVGRVLSAQALATIYKMKMIFIRRGENEKKNSSWKKKYILVVVVAVFFL